MRIAFCLFRYFPHGGMQRDFMRIAELCHARGHRLRAYVIWWDGPTPNWLELVKMPALALSRSGRYRAYRRQVARHLRAHPVDRLVGFNRMDGLDVYFAADGCYADKLARTKPLWYRHTPRARRFLAEERALAASRCQILCLSEAARAGFAAYDGIIEDRLHLLPPGIAADRRMRPEDNESGAMRQRTRAALAVADQAPLLLFVGSAGYATKGLDRAIRALATLPDALLLVAGGDRSSRYRRLSRRLGCADRVRFLGPRDDIPALMQAADLLVHPARWENTGAALLEALVAGLPVICTSICGYATFISQAEAGQALADPFDQGALNTALRKALTDPARRSVWRDNALGFAESHSLDSLIDACVTHIEQLGSRG